MSNEHSIEQSDKDNQASLFTTGMACLLLSVLSFFSGVTAAIVALLSLRYIDRDVEGETIVRKVARKLSNLSIALHAIWLGYEVVLLAMGEIGSDAFFELVRKALFG